MAYLGVAVLGVAVLGTAVLHTQNCSSDPALGSAACLSHTGSIIIEHAGAKPVQVEFTMV
jgi:hypothetical protein